MLSLKHIAISSFNENIVYLHRDCVAYQIDDIAHITKVEVHGGAAPVFALLEIVDDSSIVSPNELGLNNEAFSEMNLPEGANISISIAGTPPSASLVQKKISGNVLSSSPISLMISFIIRSESEVS